ncbi:MAG: hypothetical protein JW844_06020 [Candidatus Omnitrophica bacterium]|nr:hypothetical protein [Candidatus Omnitrophota bacterium]
MTLNEKIKLLAKKEKGWKLKDLHQAIQRVFGEKGVTYFTLSRTGKRPSQYRDRTLHQICSVLGITKEELFKGTDEEGGPIGEEGPLCAGSDFGRLCYSDNAYLEILTPPGEDPKRMRLILGPGGKTKLTKELPGRRKRLYVLEGHLDAYVGNAHYHLEKDASLTFDSELPCQFANEGGSFMRCLIDECRKENGGAHGKTSGG